MLLAIIRTNFSWSFFKNTQRDVSCKKRVFKNFAKFTGKHLYRNLFLNKVPGLQPVTSITFLTEHLYFLKQQLVLTKEPQSRKRYFCLFCTNHASIIRGLSYFRQCFVLSFYNYIMVLLNNHRETLRAGATAIAVMYFIENFNFISTLFIKMFNILIIFINISSN